MKSVWFWGAVLVIVIIVVLVLRPHQKTPIYKQGQYTQQDFEKAFSSIKDTQFTMAKPPVGVIYPYGDINGDKKVNILDLLTLINIVYKKPVQINRRADINGDCFINYDDLMYFIDWAFLNSNKPPVKPCSIKGE